MAVSDLLKAAGVAGTARGSSNPVGINALLAHAQSEQALPPEQIQRNLQLPQIQADANNAAIDSKNANSFGGIALNTIKAIGSKFYDAGNNAVTGLANTYGSVVPTVKSQIQAGAGDIQKGLGDPTLNGGLSVLKGTGKAVLGTAGVAAGAVYAPISAAIGAALDLSGGQELFDGTGQKIADTSGITDFPAFQKFAMSHPLAGDYFQQIMNLALSGGEKGKILDQSKKTAQAIVDSAHKPAAPVFQSAGGEGSLPERLAATAERKVPVSGDTSLRQIPVSGESVETPVIPANRYTPSEQLPTIQTGDLPRDTSGLPTIQTEAPTTSGPVTEPINTVNRQQVQAEPVSKVPVSQAKTDGVVINPDGSKTTTSNGGRVSITESAVPNESTAPIATSGDKIPTKVANDISNKAVNNGFKALTSEQKSTYTSGSYKDSAEQAKILKETDPEALKQMAITGKDIPAGVHPQILFNVAEEMAADTKDYRLQQDLAQSPLGTERSQLAQGLGGSGYNKVKESPVDVIKRAISDKAGGTKGKEEISKEATKAKSAITKAAAQAIDYQSIIDAIKTC